MKENIFKRIKDKKILTLLLMFLLSFTLVSCSSDVVGDSESAESVETLETLETLETAETVVELEEDSYYTSKEDVSLYIYTYNKLPDNFINKNEARDLGWESNEGNLWEVTDKKSIGGDRFGNREGLLPDKEGRQYYECDINYEGGYRDAERLVYSNDGLIYYTADHYESFELLYGNE